MKIFDLHDKLKYFVISLFNYRKKPYDYCEKNYFLCNTLICSKASNNRGFIDFFLAMIYYKY